MAQPARRHRGLKILGVIVLLIVLLAIFWDWNWFRGIASAQATAALGRKVEIGHLDGRILRWHPWVAVDDMTIANPDEFGASDPTFFSVKRLSARWSMGALFNRNAFIEEIWVQSPKSDLKPGPSGKANYLFDLPKKDASKPAPPPDPNAPAWSVEIASLIVRDGDIHFVDPKLKSDFRLGIHTDTPRTDGKAPDLHVDIDGKYSGQPINGRFIGSSVLTLRDPANPYAIDLKLANGNTKVAIDGTLLRPLEFGGANVRLEFSGDNLADLYPLTGVPLPATPAFKLAGQLDYAKPNIRFKDFTGTVGSSDLNGTFFIEPKRGRPRVTADLFSKRIVMADLAGLIGAPPGKADAPSDTKEAKQQRKQANASGKLLPDTTLNFPKLNSADLDIKYKAGHIEGEAMPIDNLSWNLTIIDGVVAIKPLAFGIGQGSITANADLDARSSPAKLVAVIDFRKVDLAKLMKTTGAFKGEGTIGGHAAIDTRGDSVAQMLGGGNGELKLFASGGNLTSLLVDLVGLDLGNGMLSLLGIPNRADLRCLVGDFGLKGGQVQTRTMLIDTSEANLVGSGKIDLTNETLDYKLATEPKHFNIGSVATPINITGTLANPTILPAAGPLAARGAAAVALGIVATPLAALIPTIQLGIGEDNDCKSLIDDLKPEQVSAQPPKRVKQLPARSSK
jgi:uncharacterized protein involved in outer membrane biogenesis